MHPRSSPCRFHAATTPTSGYRTRRLNDIRVALARMGVNAAVGHPEPSVENHLFLKPFADGKKSFFALSVRLADCGNRLPRDNL